MKPNNFKLTKYIDFDFENKDKDSKYNVSGHVRILKHKSINTKGYTTNW